MEVTFLLSSVLFLLLLAFKLFFHKREHWKNLPPSPPALPVIGHLHLFKQPLHRSLLNLSKKYGSIFYLRLGSRPAIVVSSPSTVKECFTKNDIVWANRPPLIMGKYITYNHTSITTSPYGDHWRNLRRISALEIFSTNRLNKFLSIRRDEVKIFLKKLYRVSSNNDFAEVKQLNKMLLELTFSIIMRMVTGKRYSGDEEAEFKETASTARQFRDIITEIFHYAEASYAGDFLPILEWIDYQGYSKRAKQLGKTCDLCLQGLIDEQRNDSCSSNSMISHLLSLQESQPQYYTDEIIKTLILDIILGGTETSSITMEWALSNLLNNPQILNKAKVEIDREIGEENLMDESDISKLSYLQNIISETLRLHPAGPLLVPHFSHSDCRIEEYDVPKNTLLLVNAWAIHRDPQLWDDAMEFKPERFQGNDQGETFNYKYLPFGFGRRICPGMSLANRVVGFVLGSMIQCFEWKRVADKEIDMTEGFGLAMPKAHPLEASCKARDIMKVVSCS